MTRIVSRIVLGTVVAIVTLLWNGEVPRTVRNGLTSTAQALIGRPLTPMSYAGVARRTTVRLATPGVGRVGVGYSGGVGMNLGGPVNRVGVR
jgi:hypothetical protein